MSVLSVPWMTEIFFTMQDNSSKENGHTMGIFGKKAVHHRLSYKWDRDTLGERCFETHTFLFQRNPERNWEM